MKCNKFAGIFILALMAVLAVSSCASAEYTVERDSPYHASKWKSYENVSIYSTFGDYGGVFGGNCFMFARLVTNRTKHVDFNLQADGKRAIDFSSIKGVDSLAGRSRSDIVKTIAQRFGPVSQAQLKSAFAIANVKEGDVIQLMRYSSNQKQNVQHTMIVVKVYDTAFTTLEANWQSGCITNEKKYFKNLASDISLAGDSGGFTIYRFGIDEVRPVIQSVPLGSYVAGTHYSESCRATGSNITWSISSGSLPPGMSINSSTGEISGTPSHTSRGKSDRMPVRYNFTVTASNSAGSSSKTTRCLVYEPPEITTDSKLYDIPAGIGTRLAIRASGTEYTIKWKLKSGTLPPGMTFNGPRNNRVAEISGVPSRAGTYRFQVECSNLVGNPNTTTRKWFSITVTGTVPPRDNRIIIDGDFKNGIVGTYYYKAIKVNPNAAGFSWSQTLGELPEGLYLLRSGRYLYLYGTPTKAGTYNFSINIAKIAYVGGQARYTGQNVFSYTVTITEPNTSERPSSAMSTRYNFYGGKIGTSYNSYILVNGGVAPYTARVVSGTAPTGLTFSTAANKVILQGIPRGQSKIFNFTLRIKGANNGYVDKNCTLNIAYNPAYPAGDDGEESLTKPKILSKSLADATVNTEYSAKLEASGATPMSWTLLSNLPEGLNFNEDDGTIAGIFTEAGKYSFTVRVDNPAGSKTQTVKIKVLSEKPSILTESLPMAVLREEYNIPLEADGTDIKWSKSGSLPSGLKLDKKAGIIYGTPKKKGTYTFTITAKNKAGSDSREFTMTVDPGDPPVIELTSLPEGTAKTPYEVNITTSGSNPIKWLKNGSLPSGLKLDKKTGILSGTPKKPGTYTISIMAANDAGTDTKEFELVIKNPGGGENNTNSNSNDNSESDSKTSNETSTLVDIESENNEQINDGSGGILTPLYLVSNDENLEDSITVKAGQDLTFKIGEWVNDSGVAVEVSDVKIFINDEISPDIEISDDDSFILPGKSVSGEFTVYAKSFAGSLELTTKEINIIADSESGQSDKIISASGKTQDSESSAGCNISFAGIILLALCGTVVFKKK